MQAAQALEPAALVAMRLVRPGGSVVLVGDPKQLPATVLSQAASARHLNQSLFERLERASPAEAAADACGQDWHVGSGCALQSQPSLPGSSQAWAALIFHALSGLPCPWPMHSRHESVQGGMPVAMLSEQYRMDPAISAFPASFFYGSQLQDHASVVQRAAAGDLPGKGYFRALAFFDCRHAPAAALRRSRAAPPAAQLDHGPACEGGSGMPGGPARAPQLWAARRLMHGACRAGQESGPRSGGTSFSNRAEAELALTLLQGEHAPPPAASTTRRAAHLQSCGWQAAGVRGWAAACGPHLQHQATCSAAGPGQVKLDDGAGG